MTQSPNDPSPSARDELLDRGTDLDLRAAIGGERAPDLTGRILRRHEARLAGAAVAAPAPQTCRRLLLAACVVLGVGAVVAIAALSRRDAQGGAAPVGESPLAPTLDPNRVAPVLPDDPTADGGAVDAGSADASRAEQRQDPSPGTVEVVLANGVRVLIHRVAGSGQVGVETIYRVGFLHEPEGLTQAAHLLEHIACYGATKSYAAGESFALLQELGSANAETLPDCTHYDYLLPADRLELALQIEVERMTSLEITRELVEQEAPRCDLEAEFVSANPQTGMVKHAFMALAQGWRHGAGRASIRGGMGDYDVAALRAFHNQTYRPSRLTVAIVGDVEPEAALELVRGSLGAVPPRRDAPAEPVRWEDVPAKHDVRWNGSPRAICLAWAPPATAEERLYLTVVGQTLHSMLMADRAVGDATEAVFASNWTWGVGELPFFVYASAAEGTSLDELEALLQTRLAALLARPLVTARGAERQAAGLQGRIQQLTPAYLRTVGPRLRRPGVDDVQAAQMVLAQAALNWDVAARRDDGGAIGRVGDLSPAQVAALLAALAPENCKVTRLVPE